MRFMIRILAAGMLATTAPAAELPGGYYQILDPALDHIAGRLSAEPDADIDQLEKQPGWRHSPSAVLVAAVLYAKDHPDNPRYQDPAALSVAVDIGDRLAKGWESGAYDERLDHHRDTYMWLDAYRLLENDLGSERRERWGKALVDLIAPLAPEVAKRQDHPRYNSPYLITSPNHYSLWSSTLYLGGIVFDKPEWRQLGAKVMHRFATEEQSPDGYWGEHTRAGPTTGYDYLTSAGVALYWEHSKDPTALEALGRSLRFHQYFTYPDGTPVETVNDRNRYWGVSMWGHFGFSNFPGGRRYAEFLIDQYDTDSLSLESLGRIAQNALYYHEGPVGSMPLDEESFVHRMSVPAGMRKAGEWVLCLSGIISTSTMSRFYLDRQSALSVFHERLGQIISGSNSKLQPELATFSERIDGEVHHMPLSSRLDMDEKEDRLALAYDGFFSVLTVPEPAGDRLEFGFRIYPKGRMAETTLTLQLALEEGETIRTGGGAEAVLGREKIDWTAKEIQGEIRYGGWKLTSDAPLRLVWPVYPYNPYAYARETELTHAVGALATDLEVEAQTIRFAIEAE